MLPHEEVFLDSEDRDSHGLFIGSALAQVARRTRVAVVFLSQGWIQKMERRDPGASRWIEFEVSLK